MSEDNHLTESELMKTLSSLSKEAKEEFISAYVERLDLDNCGDCRLADNCPGLENCIKLQQVYDLRTRLNLLSKSSEHTISTIEEAITKLRDHALATLSKEKLLDMNPRQWYELANCELEEDLEEAFGGVWKILEKCPTCTGTCGNWSRDCR